MSLKYKTIVNGPFQENCFLTWDDSNMEGVFIDPGDEPERLIKTANSLGVKIIRILCTHAHIDHAGAVSIIKEELDVPFAMNPLDKFILEGLSSQAKMFGLNPITAPLVDIELGDGDTLKIGSHEGKVIHTPGHTPGGVCFSFDDVVFAGDTLFAGSVGRSDLPGGSHTDLINSIKQKLLVLDDNVKVLCGHGPATTIGMEKMRNPFLTGEI